MFSKYITPRILKLLDFLARMGSNKKKYWSSSHIKGEKRSKLSRILK